VAKVILIAGLGFGDEGKGSIVDYLTRLYHSKLVVRYCGGAQAAHNVVLPNGTHHTFAQFGSGTLAGADTLLSRYMMVNPLALEEEVQALVALGHSPYNVLFVEGEALVTNVYQVAANRLRETIRNKRHGSCGMGIGETAKDALEHPDMALRIGDLPNRDKVHEKLRFSRNLKLKEFEGCDIDAGDPNLLLLRDEAALSYYAVRYHAFGCKINIVDRNWLEFRLSRDSTVIFEGAQGVLLDQDYGFFPYVTRSDITFNNAYELLGDFNGPVRRMGILRAYMTRHGAGPFPTEVHDKDAAGNCTEYATDTHNKYGEWQQSFRLGHFDMVLARYALEVIGGVDELVITNLDKLRVTDRPSVCVGYVLEKGVSITKLPVQQRLDLYGCLRGLEPNLDKQEELTRKIENAIPVVKLFDRSAFLDDIAQELKTPVTLCSTGPTYEDKTPWPREEERHGTDSDRTQEQEVRPH